MSQTSQSRQPKGKREGGQFAESKNPEPDVDLSQAPRPIASMDEIVNAISDLESYYVTKDASDLDEGMHDAINNLLSLRLPEPSSDGSSLEGRSPHTGDLPMDRQSIIDRLHQEFDMPDSTRIADSYEPNDKGVDLINGSSIEIVSETETLRGVAWSGKLRIGHAVLDVSNSGDGGSNDYARASSVDPSIESLHLLVASGFSNLDGAEALDDFCTILEVAKSP